MTVIAEVVEMMRRGAVVSVALGLAAEAATVSGALGLIGIPA